MTQLLLHVSLNLDSFKFDIMAFLTAFIVAIITMPFLIKLIMRYKLFDVPDQRKEHKRPIPTMGGIASTLGMVVAAFCWGRFQFSSFEWLFFLSVIILFTVGIFDDLKNLNARYKLVVQLIVAGIISAVGVRIDDFYGLFGIHALPVGLQYFVTILAITGITNAFNLIDGIDGLAGGLGFMSLVILGIFLSFSGDGLGALLAFCLAGGLLGFLYYNFNPARIFMGDTGSLVLGFTVSVLVVRLLQLNAHMSEPVLPHAPVFALSVVGIPVFDTLRVFSIRIWQGKSPFSPDKNHVHHLLTNNGWNHAVTSKAICGVHAVILLLGYFLKDVPQLLAISILIVIMLLKVLVFQRLQTQEKRIAAAGLES